jgi:hypothetical protein
VDAPLLGKGPRKKNRNPRKTKTSGLVFVWDLNPLTLRFEILQTRQLLDPIVFEPSSNKNQTIFLRSKKEKLLQIFRGKKNAIAGFLAANNNLDRNFPPKFYTNKEILIDSTYFMEDPYRVTPKSTQLSSNRVLQFWKQ